jgi:putative methyltransferase (TIGR04325 family)
VKRKLYPILRALRKVLVMFGRSVTETYHSELLTQRVIQGDLFSWRNHQGSKTMLAQHWHLLHAGGLSDSLVPSVLDFGGGGGRLGFQYVREGKAKWTVLETSAMTAAAHDRMAEVPIDFVDSIDALIQEQRLFDALFCRSAFQYTQDPAAMLRSALSLTKGLLVLEQVVLSKGKSTTKFLQTSFLGDNLADGVRQLKDYFYVTEYPLIAISIEEFLTILQEDFHLVRIEERPPASHLPRRLNLSEYDVVALRRNYDSGRS